MANLYGRMYGDYRKEVTRTGHGVIYARLETWEGAIEITLDKDGQFAVGIGDKYNPRTPVAFGNVNTEEIYPSYEMERAVLAKQDKAETAL